MEVDRERVIQALCSHYANDALTTQELEDRFAIANRATFVVDKEGKIQHIEEGSAAVDISGAMNACSRLSHK